MVFPCTKKDLNLSKVKDPRLWKMCFYIKKIKVKTAFLSNSLLKSLWIRIRQKKANGNSLKSVTIKQQGPCSVPFYSIQTNRSMCVLVSFVWASFWLNTVQLDSVNITALFFHNSNFRLGLWGVVRENKKICRILSVCSVLQKLP